MIDIYFDPTSHTHPHNIYTYSQKIASLVKKMSLDALRFQQITHLPLTHRVVTIDKGGKE